MYAIPAEWPQMIVDQFMILGSYQLNSTPQTASKTGFSLSPICRNRRRACYARRIAKVIRLVTHHSRPPAAFITING
jgi:hypothetical protein